jgi:hypothetical protein
LDIINLVIYRWIIRVEKVRASRKKESWGMDQVQYSLASARPWVQTLELTKEIEIERERGCRDAAKDLKGITWPLFLTLRYWLLLHLKNSPKAGPSGEYPYPKLRAISGKPSLCPGPQPSLIHVYCTPLCLIRYDLTEDGTRPQVVT